MNELIELNQIKAIPAKVDGLDFDKARKAIEAKLEVYMQMVVTDENTPAIKKIIAELRKESKDLNDIKIQIKKELTKNVTEMESEFKSLIGIYDKAILPLDSKVKEYEQGEYEKRKKNVLAQAQGHLNGTPFTLNDLEIPEKWFNKGTGEGYITEDVTEQIANLKEKMAAIQDSINSKNEILGTNDLKFEFYAQSLKNPLHQTLAHINATFEMLKKKAAEKAEHEKIEAMFDSVYDDRNIPEMAEGELPFCSDFVAPWEDEVPTYRTLKINANDFKKAEKLLRENGISFLLV